MISGTIMVTSGILIPIFQIIDIQRLKKKKVVILNESP